MHRPSRVEPRFYTAVPIFFTVLLLASCASVPHPPLPQGPLSDCRQLFIDLDRRIELADARDQGPRIIAGFPYLRVNRFLASFRNEELDAPQQAAWVQEMAILDAQARPLELANMGGKISTSTTSGLTTQLNHCRSLLVADLLARPDHIQLLRQSTRVKDDYVRFWRIAGFYPISAMFVSHGIGRWHRETREIFSASLNELPVKGQLLRWGNPASSTSTVALGVQRNALGIPQPSESQLDELFRRHAPIWEIDVVDDNDLIGTARWVNGPVIDPRLATQYQLLSQTRFGDQVLIQLNYVIWFRARPGDDIYAGDIDGLIWRVTLGPDGTPWLYDSIHNCGCYHQFFPAGPLQLRTDQNWPEPPLVPQRAPQPPLVIRLDSGRHFIQRVYTADAKLGTRPLVLEDYNRLRALPTPDDHHSLFGAEGLVAGSERPERFLLWPMGIRSAGAMRQWGRHPVAFIGRRHFDDPRLIESLFHTGGNNSPRR